MKKDRQSGYSNTRKKARGPKRVARKAAGKRATKKPAARKAAKSAAKRKVARATAGSRASSPRHKARAATKKSHAARPAPKAVTPLVADPEAEDEFESGAEPEPLDLFPPDPEEPADEGSGNDEGGPGNW